MPQDTVPNGGPLFNYGNDAQTAVIPPGLFILAQAWRQLAWVSGAALVLALGGELLA